YLYGFERSIVEQDGRGGGSAQQLVRRLMIHPNIAGIVALASFIGMHAIFGCELARDGSPSRAGQELDRDTYAKRVAPDLAIEQVATPAMAKPGAEVTFTLT